MKVCLMIEGQEGVAWEDWVALARAVEGAGLDGLFRSDHYTSFHGGPGAALDAWATLSALGAITERIRLGTLVTPATFRHPSEQARVVVTADHVSGGRMEVGIGAGWFEKEHRQNGFAFPVTKERFDRMEEYLEVLIGSWRGETFDFQGQHFQLEGQVALPRPVQTPHPPVIMGGRGARRSLALATRYAQEYNSAFLPVDECQALRGRLDAACRAAEREAATLPMSLMALMAVGREREEAERRLQRMLSRFRGPAERCHVGTVDEMYDRLRAFEAAGVSRVYLQHPDRSDFAGIELFGELAGRLQN
jgi:F420-dependent oxidoreductase-like protein